jgi:chondroitin 4-sulfotransferase 11
MTVISIDKKYVFTSVYKTGSASLANLLTSNHFERISLKHPIFKRTNIDSMFKNNLLVGGYIALNNTFSLPAEYDVIKYTPHSKSSTIKEILFHEESGLVWDDFFKFGFVRNPWDRELSNYFFNNETLKPPKNISFKRWLKYTLKEDAQIGVSKSPQFEYLTDVDYVARFENYTEEVKYIFNKLKLPLPNKLQHIHKTEHKPYWEYYDDVDIMRVHQWYEKDIEMYDYEFGQ